MYLLGECCSWHTMRFSYKYYTGITIGIVFFFLFTQQVTSVIPIANQKHVNIYMYKTRSSKITHSFVELGIKSWKLTVKKYIYTITVLGMEALLFWPQSK